MRTSLVAPSFVLVDLLNMKMEVKSLSDYRLPSDPS
jgi:hypothetical protein